MVTNHVKQSAAPVGPRLKAIREAWGVSVEAQAKAMGVLQCSVCQLETRGNVTVETLRRYAQALGGSVAMVIQTPHGTEAL